ncbi:MAG: pentapeptide repeat-containing protein [Treponema sp.]|nr:pentapeptide repeat-containing protein [Treponema sp.]
MNEISKAKTFMDTGSYQREKEDLTYHIFRDLNFLESKRHISFFRTDFRGSNFINVKFYRNNFDRADFISCSIRNCSFDSVDFGGCEIKNCYFEEIVFKNNKYDGTAIHQSSFIDCQFSDEQFLLTMYDCKFINCSFCGCRYERSSTEKLEFIGCQIFDTDLATMHAEGHTFISCKLNNVCLGSYYVFGYLLYNTKLDDVDFLYHGEKVSFDVIEGLYKKLLSESRHFEFINATVILKNLYGISDTIIKAIDRLRSFEIIQFRHTELSNILTAICFYIRYSMLPFDELVKILDYLDRFNWQQFTFEETLGLLSKIEMIKHIMSAGEYQLSPEFISTIPYNGFALISFQCNTDDFEEAVAVANSLIENSLRYTYIPELYCLLDQKKGSWELTFLIPACCAMLILLILKNTAGIIMEFSFKRKFGKSLLAKLSDNTTINDLESIAKTATIAKIINNDAYDLLSLPTIDKAISNIVKSIKIGI